MRDVTKMKNMLEKEREQEKFFDTETADAIDTIKKKYLTTCGGSLAMPSKNDNPLHTEMVLVGFDWDEDLHIKRIGDCSIKQLIIPKELVDKFFKLIINTKSQRDGVLKGIENLRNEEAED